MLIYFTLTFASTTSYPIGLADVLVIVAYLVTLLVIGWRAMLKIHGQEDFFLGGRKFGKLIQTFASFGQATSAESAVGMTTLVQTNGASGIWSTLAGGLVFMPVFWMTSIWYRRMRMMTLADFFVERYGSRAMGGFYAGFQTVFFMIVAALGLSAMSKTVAAISAKSESQLTVVERVEYQSALELEELERVDVNSMNDSQRQRLHELRLQGDRKEFTFLNERAVIVCVAFFVLLYSVAGGLEAAFVSDIIQSAFIIVLSIILIPFAMIKINKIHGGEGLLGPFQVMHDMLPQWFFEIWGSPNVVDFSWHWIAVMGVLGMLNVGIQANQMVVSGSAKDELSARVGMTVGIFIKRVLTIVWGLIAMLTVVLYGTSIKNPDYIWGYATRDLLGPLGLGLVGLMIACMFAALMSTLSALMITTSGLITNNLYRPLVPNRNDRHYLLVGRITSVVYIVGAVLIAIQYANVFSLMKLVWVFNCALAASFWLGMLWRRATAVGAWASIVLTTLFTLVLPVGVALLPGIRTHEYLVQTTNPLPVERIYTATEADVREREEEIAEYDNRTSTGVEGARPQTLIVGEQFSRTFLLPKKSIFWEEDVALINDKVTGRGMLKVELLLMDWLGMNLAQNSYSFNETLMLLFRLILPFGTLFLVSLLTAPDSESRLNQFYAKMRTPVKLDPIEDQQEVELSKRDPHRFDSSKLFPNSSWEFRKWQLIDVSGFLAASCGVLACVALLWLIVNIGA